jgi:WD40 repeat protein
MYIHIIYITTPLLSSQIWDIKSGSCIHTLKGHTDEILDVTFNKTGSRVASASADGNAHVYNTVTGECQAVLTGEIYMYVHVIFFIS